MEAKAEETPAVIQLEISPTFATELTLEWANQLRRNPAAIKATRLWHNAGTIDKAFELARIKRNTVS